MRTCGRRGVPGTPALPKLACHGDVRLRRDDRFVDVDVEKGLLLVKGAVPGARGSTVVVRTAVKGGK